MPTPVLVGAVVYDPKVVVIWDIIKEFFRTSGCPMDYIFFSNYEMQVDALMAGTVDIAWNSPLAWLDAQRQSGHSCRAVAMRDTDRDRRTHLVARVDSGVLAASDLSGRTIALGAKDSPQATLIPLGLLHRSGLDLQSVRVRRHDVLVGKHGDHIGGEKDAFADLAAGRADACAMLDLNWQLWSSDGTIDPTRYRVIATTGPFDHCVFTVKESMPADRLQPWLDTLFTMSYENPAHREMMDMEGLKVWEEGRTTGFGPLSEAVEVTDYWEDAGR